MIDKAEKLKSILELLKADTVSPSDIEKFLASLVQIIKQTNDSFKTLSAENIQEIKNALSYIYTEHSQILKEIDGKNSKLEGTFKAQIALVERLLSEVKAIEVKDGKDGVDGQIGRA